MRVVRPNYRVVAAVMVLLVSVGSARAFWAPKHHKRDVRAEVVAVDKQWRDAEATNDAVSLEKLLAEDYLGISGNGQVLTKQQQLERVRSRQTQFDKLEITDLKIKLVGSVAIVTSAAELSGTMDGHTIHGAFRSTRVYQRTVGGVWQITSFEATPTRHPDHQDQPQT